ncbi:small multi-drug export protein [Candidatus Uhrbacteria bacterium]|nr:small multi-drug export protein [Candidatus Uhrbacteria bacterium]
MNGELQVILLSALPIAELRVALPVAILQYNFSPLYAFFLSVTGNFLPIAIVLFFFPPLLRFAEKHIPTLHRLIESYLRSLERRHQKKYQKYGAFFLFLFVAVPFPGTGAWTGSILAVLFGIKPRASIPALVCGVLLVGLVVLYLTLGYAYFF